MPRPITNQTESRNQIGIPAAPSEECSEQPSPSIASLSDRSNNVLELQTNNNDLILIILIKIVPILFDSVRFWSVSAFTLVNSMSPCSPKDPSRINAYPYELDTVKDTSQGDFYSILSLVFGMISVSLRYRHVSWLSLIFSIASVANLNTITLSITSVFSSLTFAILSISMNYLSTKRE